MTRAVTLTVNGVERTAEVEPRTLLVHFLREHLNLTGTHVGCDTSNCGACTVWLDGDAVKACTILAVQADGGQVTTIEGISATASCIPCSGPSTSSTACSAATARPGMVMSAIKLLRVESQPDRGARSGSASRATCAAAPAIRTSWPRCAPRRKG